MSERYLVLAASHDSAQEIQAQLNQKAKEGYRLVGIVPPRPGFSADALLVLEKEEDPAASVRPAAGVARQKMFGTK
jgi:hypothetical protein